MAVKKGPNARGGLVWKTHAFYKMSQTRQRNAAKNTKLIREVDETLKRAAALDPARAAAASTATVTKL
ncbi:unnamed product [Ostreococcus tauri]|uniref:Unnamed product n=1 Tax=Ostreococcus tauri TaxID=70448 RepID=A0A096PAT6_OSTTA|nr:unnamed product [Ostreococcus tauri]CEG01819.1 unnamed product [Ostreococcus tauri]|eukprot:XP_022841190.1 unnamed product [Ostreococcus tauri]